MTTLYWSGNKTSPNLNPLQAFPLSWQLWEIIQKNGILFGWGEAWKRSSLKRRSICKSHVLPLFQPYRTPPSQELSGPILWGKREEIGLSSHALTSISPKGQAKRGAQTKSPEPDQHHCQQHCIMWGTKWDVGHCLDPINHFTDALIAIIQSVWGLLTFLTTSKQLPKLSDEGSGK